MRYYTTLFASLAVPLLVSARPIRSRAASANDALVLNFAAVLEGLESQFYSQALAKFQDSDFTAAGFTSSQIATQAFTAIGKDEATHLAVLQQALKDNGADPLTCEFDFSSVLTDVSTMAATARVVEMVGVAAYLGGATIIDDPILLDAAASILTVEARHQTMLNILAGSVSIPQAFDIPLTPQEVLSIAGGFITGTCNTGITPTTTLTITNTDTVTVGTLLTFSADGMSNSDGLFCNMMVGGSAFSINLPIAQCIVPPGIDGPVAIWITSDNNPLVNNVIDRDTTKQVAGPVMAFVDSNSEVLGQLVRGSSTSGAATTTTTTTISPDEAASIIQGASATATASDSSNTSGSDSSSSGSDSASSSPSDSSSGSDGAASPPSSSPLGPSPDGPSPDGKVDVLGLSSVPRPTNPSTASGSAVLASATSSASDSAASASASSS